MEITNKETVYKGHYQLQVYTVTDGESEFKREVFQTGQAATALVYDTKKEKFIFAKQFRPAIERELLETVAGMLDSEAEKPADTITREIKEEIGYAVDKLEFIYEFFPSPGAFAEKLYLFYAEVSQQVSEGGGVDDEHEDIKTVEMTADEMLSHSFSDGKTLLAVEWAKTNVVPRLQK